MPTQTPRRDAAPADDFFGDGGAGAPVSADRGADAARRTLSPADRGADGSQRGAQPAGARTTAPHRSSQPENRGTAARPPYRPAHAAPPRAARRRPFSADPGAAALTDETAPRARFPRAARRRRLPLRVWLALLLAVLLLAALAAVVSARQRFQESSSSLPAEKFTNYDGFEVPLYANVARCAWADADFTKDAATGRIAYPGAQTGVDVSSHQGDIDWAAVAQDGVTWASLRAGRRGYTEGGLFTDEKFEANYTGARAANLDVGVYFFSQAVSVDEARAEAAYLLKLLNGRTLQGPVVFDWEDIAGEDVRTRTVDTATLTAMANAFCADVTAAGYTTAVYTNRTTAYARYDLSALDGQPVWLASYNDTPGYYYNFTMWQYTNEGTVAGIQGAVDLNLRLPA